MQSLVHSVLMPIQPIGILNDLSVSDALYIEINPVHTENALAYSKNFEK